MSGTRQKLNKEIVNLKNTISQLDVIDIQNAHKQQPSVQFSQVHMEHSKINHMLGHKTSLNTFKETEIT